MSIEWKAHFVSWPSKIDGGEICAKVRNKSTHFPPCTLQSCLWSHMCFTGQKETKSQVFLHFIIKDLYIWGCVLQAFTKRHFQLLLSSYWELLSLPWNLSPGFPPVRPSGPWDSLGDLALLPGSGSDTAWRTGSSLLLGETGTDSLQPPGKAWPALQPSGCPQNSSVGCLRSVFAPHSAWMKHSKLCFLPGALARSWEK